jgi:hypothetical protein
MDINQEFLNDKNYYSGLNKLIVNSPEIWKIMIEEDLLTVSGNDPTDKTYYHLCLLGQKHHSRKQ